MGLFWFVVLLFMKIESNIKVDMKVSMSSRLLIVIFLNLFIASGHAYAENLSPLSQLKAIYKLSASLTESISRSEFERATSKPNGHLAQCIDIPLTAPDEDDWDWVITKSDAQFLTIGHCGTTDDVFHIRAYAKKNGDTLYLLAHESGIHGQTWDFEAYISSKTNKKMTPVKPEKLGLIAPKENEFLPRKLQFPKSDNFGTTISLDENGVLPAFPWTWQNPKWDDRKPTYDIYFKWNGSTFIKHKVKAQPYEEPGPYFSPDIEGVRPLNISRGLTPGGTKVIVVPE